MPHTKVFFTFYFEVGARGQPANPPLSPFQNMFIFGMNRLPNGAWDIVWPFPSDEPLPCLVPSDAGAWVRSRAPVHPGPLC